ncbi:MAG: hypothetical protein KAJ40_06665 [Alphaproteobacteria bacterium]|nr:hypothetical protein [Alphaproteobacteria bacterium]
MIEVLYSLVGGIVAIGYLPQIIKLIKAQIPCHDISLIAWTVWTYTSAISLIYSLYGQDSVDHNFVFANAVNLTCIMLIVFITLYKRYKYGKATIQIPSPQNHIEETI